MAHEHYLEVRHAVAPELEDAVRRALAYAVRQLGIKHAVHYRFFVPGSATEADRWHARTWRDPHSDPPAPMAGAVFRWESPPTVWVSCDLTPRQAAHTALHEAVHIMECSMPEGGMADRWEESAESFANAHIERSLN